MPPSFKTQKKSPLKRNNKMSATPQNKYTFLAVLLLILSGCAGTKSLTSAYQPLTTQQRAAMQTKELDGNFDTGFTATLSVLQDEGWQIKVVDKPSGIIQAASLKRQSLLGPVDDWHSKVNPDYIESLKKNAAQKGAGMLEWTRWEQLTVHIEPWGKNTIRERITITKFGSLPSNTYSYTDKKEIQKTATIGAKEQSMVLEDPAAYQYLFQKIQRAIFIRQGLTNQN